MTDTETLIDRLTHFAALARTVGGTLPSSVDEACCNSLASEAEALAETLGKILTSASVVPADLDALDNYPMDAWLDEEDAYRDQERRDGFVPLPARLPHRPTYIGHTAHRRAA
ncbi:MAG: hypothetical protein QM753_11910 [Thermomicrobiales bacterium]